MHQIYCRSIKLTNSLIVLDWIWYGGVVRIPPYEKQNKASSGAQNDTKVGRGGDLRNGSPKWLKQRRKLYVSSHKKLENKLLY